MLVTVEKTKDKNQSLTKRLSDAMTSGKSVKIPKGLTREQKRAFILNN
ncbi:hypothetical protein M2H13_22850 [Vibrio vulnificus]|nr:hypothetical protein [Vibrio vulnificus]